MRPANERRRYNIHVTSSLIGWVHAENDPWHANVLLLQNILARTNLKFHPYDPFQVFNRFQNLHIMHQNHFHTLCKNSNAFGDNDYPCPWNTEFLQNWRFQTSLCISTANIFLLDYLLYSLSFMTPGIDINRQHHQVLLMFLIWWLICVNGLKSSPPGQNGRHFADDVFKCIFLNVLYFDYNLTEVCS